MTKKPTPMTENEQKQMDFLFSFPDIKIISLGDGTQDKNPIFTKSENN